MIELKKLLPKALQNPIWNDFLDTVQDEVSSFRDENISPLRVLFDIYTLQEENNHDQLIEIAKTFGFTPDITLVENLTDEEISGYLRREVESIFYKIITKSTYNGYNSIFNTAELCGQVFSMYWNGTKLLRAFEGILPLKQRTEISITSQDWTTGAAKYFLLNTLAGEYYIWYQVSDFPTIDPEIEGRIGLQITIDSTDDESTIATLTDAGISTIANIFSATEGDSVTVEETLYGYVDPSIDGNTGFEITTLIQSTETTETIVDHDYSLPFVFKSSKNFVQFLTIPVTLDETPLKFLDDPTLPWRLDQQSVRISTNHLALEYCITQPLEEDSVSYLMTSRYMQFLKNAFLYTKKATDFPHAGCNLSILADTSTDVHEIPSIGLRAIVSNLFDFDSMASFAYMAIGTGATIFTNGNCPSELDNMVQILPIDADQIRSGTADWVMATNYFYGNAVEGEIVGAGDGATIIFDFTLAQIPVLPQFCRLTYYSGGVKYLVDDSDGSGVLTGLNAEGTINYETGEVSLTTEKERFIEEDLPNTISGYSLQRNPVIEDSFKVYYTISETEYVGTDDGGAITGTNISSGSINYATGEISITFTGSASNVSCEYLYLSTTIPDLDTDLVIDYKTDFNQEITECGVFDSSDQLVAYATFLPIVVGDIENHMGFQWFISENVI